MTKTAARKSNLRIVSLILVLAMMATLLLTNAKAAVGNTANETELLNRASVGGSSDIILSANIGTSQLTIARSLKIDLNGFILTISNGIKINAGVTLTIMDSASGGTLNAASTANSAAINTSDSTLIIESGTVNATSTNGAGIGGDRGSNGTSGGQPAGTGGYGGAGGNGGNIIINGGIVTANSIYSAGIGGGVGGTGGSGGNGTSASKTGGLGGNGGVGGNGGNLTVNGGAVTAISTYSAGIGGGSGGNGGQGGSGADRLSSEGEGPGYTGGNGGNGGGGGSGATVTLNGGIVTSRSDNNASIGGSSGGGGGGGGSYGSNYPWYMLIPGTPGSPGSGGSAGSVGSLTLTDAYDYTYWTNYINEDPTGLGTPHPPYNAYTNYTGYRYVKIQIHNIITHTVTFVDWDGTVLDVQVVEHGSSARAPAPPDNKPGEHFSRWDPEDFTEITEDLTVRACYAPDPKPPEPPIFPGPYEIVVQAKIINSESKVYNVDIDWGEMKFVFDDGGSKWDPKTHTYTNGTDEASWLINNADGSGTATEWYLEQGNNRVTVTNHSNGAIDAVFDYTMLDSAGDVTAFNTNAGKDNVVGGFYASEDDAKAGALVLVEPNAKVDYNTLPDSRISLPTAEGRFLNNQEIVGSAYFAFSGTPDARRSEVLMDFKKVGVITVTIKPNDDPVLNAQGTDF